MRELTDSELDATLQAWNEYGKEGTFNHFEAGFIVGLDHTAAQLAAAAAERDELRALCEAALRYIGGIPLDRIDYRDADEIINQLEAALDKSE